MATRSVFSVPPFFQTGNSTHGLPALYRVGLISWIAYPILTDWILYAVTGGADFWLFVANLWAEQLVLPIQGLVLPACSWSGPVQGLVLPNQGLVLPSTHGLPALYRVGLIPGSHTRSS
eukprot:6468313-Amphidinium_carterae.1